MVSDATIGAVQGRSTLQPAGNQQNSGVVQNNRNQVEDDSNQDRTQTRASGTSTAETQGTEARNNGQQESPALRSVDQNSSTVQFTGSEERGSVVDLTV